jgi:hypothetical protein
MKKAYLIIAILFGLLWIGYMIAQVFVKEMAEYRYTDMGLMFVSVIAFCLHRLEKAEERLDKIEENNKKGERENGNN